MPETIKALVIITIMGSFTLYIQSRIRPEFFSSNEFKKLCFLWLSITAAAFLSHNYWLFIFFTFIVINIGLKKQSLNNLFFTYIWLLPLLPVLSKEIPGLGGIRFLFELNYPRLLSLTILLPIFLAQNDRRKAFFRLPGDKLFTGYLLINMVISTRNGDITNILRSNLYIFTDIFLPYYAASRSFKTFNDFRKVAFVIFASASILAAVALFEIAKSWHLYSSLNNSLAINQHFSSYLFREGLLRASSSFSTSITLGYMLVIGMGMGLALRMPPKKKQWQKIIYALYAGALIATLARGPWVGCFILFAVYSLLHREKAVILKKLFALSIIAIPFAFFTSIGQKIIKLLPFSGGENEGSISYRQELFDKSWVVIQQNPILGSNTYLQTPELQSMIQGQGIIDIVNTYIRIALNSGLLGLGIFILFFSHLVFNLYKAQQKIGKKEPELHLYTISLTATLISALLIIATVSSIDIVSHLYWVLGGLASGFLYFLKNSNQHHELQTK